jgi:uncharacterized protein YgbK (DUF1537 family)
MTASRVRLTFYGDDFTGSTDVLETLSRVGLRTILFLDPPRPEQLCGAYADVQVVGVAGVSRSLTPPQMEAVLPPVFRSLKALGGRLFHYKVCSTFDSSPEIGSIGKAIDLARDIFAPTYVPIVVGVPTYRRYTVFGNLFASAAGGIFRIDRHPTMSRHPVTAMDESDLRVHLARQTAARSALFDIVDLAGAPADLDRRFRTLLQSNPAIVFFDVLDTARLAEVGRLIWSHESAAPLLAVGSVGLEHALIEYWRATNEISAPTLPAPISTVDRLMVVSGSCSPLTRTQIEWALGNGFDGIALDPCRLLADGNVQETEIDRVVRRASHALERGQSVVAYTALGPDDPRIRTGGETIRTRGENPRESGRLLGEPLGRLLRRVLDNVRLPRVVVAGGDTAGHVTKQLGIEAIEAVAPVAAGLPLCRTYRHGTADGFEIHFKPGQFGDRDLFGALLRGTAQQNSLPMAEQ